MGRPASCDCGECAKCVARVKQRERYQAMSAEDRRALVERRDPKKTRATDRVRYARNKPKRRAAMDAYVKTPAGSAKSAAAKQRWAQANREKRRAHSAVAYAIRHGCLERQGCEVCGAPAHAHHDDYGAPLEVRWLCPNHHAAVHSGVQNPGWG